MRWRARGGGPIAGGIAGALGKGFLIACAGLTVAALFGSPPVAAAGLWTILATGVFGGSCMLAAGVIRREQCEADEVARKEVRELMSLVRKMPGLEGLAADTPDEQAERFTSRLDRERCEQAINTR